MLGGIVDALRICHEMLEGVFKVLTLSMGSSHSRTIGVKRRRLRRRQETSLQFQLTNLEKTILESEDSESLVWLSRILVMSSVDEMELCQRVAHLLVRVAAENISSEDEKALKLAAAVWVTVREMEPQKQLQLSNGETLALMTIYLARATKAALVRDAMMEAHVSVRADNCGCRGSRKGGGVGAAPARGYIFPAKKLCHAVNNIRKFLLRTPSIGCRARSYTSAVKPVLILAVGG